MMLAEEVHEIWKWPNFLLLAGLLGYMIKKHGGEFLTARSAGIRESLEAGKKAQAEAEKLAAGVQAKIANLDREIADLKASAHADLERETQRLQRDTEKDLRRMEQHTAAEIEALGKRARIELRQFAGALAMDLAEQKVRSRMTPAVQSTLIENFSADMASQNSTQGGAAR